MGRGGNGKDWKSDGNGRHGRRDRLTLHSAALGSPMFQESWTAGSPLDWIEFMRRWEDRRRPSAPRDASDLDG
jgi:hypothetical protein